MADRKREGETSRFPLLLCHLFSALIKRGVVAVDVLVIGPLLDLAQAISKALIMDDLALTQEFDGIAHVRVIRQAQNVVVGHARLLLCCQVLVEVGDGITLDSHVLHVVGHARRGDGIDARGMVDEIGGKGSVHDLILADIAGQLMDDGGHHFQVVELTRTPMMELNATMLESPET